MIYIISAVEIKLKTKFERNFFNGYLSHQGKFQAAIHLRHYKCSKAFLFFFLSVKEDHFISIASSELLSHTFSHIHLVLRFLADDGEHRPVSQVNAILYQNTYPIIYFLAHHFEYRTSNLFQNYAGLLLFLIIIFFFYRKQI